MSDTDIRIGPPKDFVMTRRKTMYHHVATCVIRKTDQQPRRYRFSHLSQWELIKRVREILDASGWTSSDVIEWKRLENFTGLWVGPMSKVEINYVLPEQLSDADTDMLHFAISDEFKRLNNL